MAIPSCKGVIKGECVVLTIYMTEASTERASSWHLSQVLQQGARAGIGKHDSLYYLRYKACFKNSFKCKNMMDFRLGT